MRKISKRYMRGVSALYGDAKIDQPLARTPRVKSEHSTEFQEQIVAVTWLTKMNIPFYHIPNGGYRNPIEAAKFKRMGVQPGIPDICIPLARSGYHGLYIELKRVGAGSLTEHQKYWRDILIANGYAWFMARGANELINYVQNYLGVKA